MLVSSADVLHSWTVPALGVKADAIPGRINQLNFSSNIPGVLYGQCSEICGSQHSHMPIALTVKSGLGDSSIKYNREREGRAILIKINPGTNVHTHSISWPSKSPLWITLLKVIATIIKPTNLRINKRIIFVKSWK